MPDAKELIQKAEALGTALAEHPAVRAYAAAQTAARNDQGAQQLLRDYHEQLEKVRHLEAEQHPIEVADKHRLRELEQQMAGNEALKKLMRTQADYISLMSQVNRAIDGPVSKLIQPESPS